MSARVPVCSGCLVPWTSSRYKTCDSCRARPSHQKRAPQSRSGPKISPIPLAPAPVHTRTLQPSVVTPNPLSRTKLLPISLAPAPVRTSTLQPLAVTPSHLPFPNSPPNSLSPAPVHAPTLQTSAIAPSPLSQKRVHDPRSCPLSQNVKRQRIIPNPDSAQEAFVRALNFIRDEYKSRVAASEQFPPIMSSSIVRSSVARYEDIMTAAAKRGLCASCGKIVPTSDVRQVEHGDHILNVLKGSLDSCGRHENTWDICSTCYGSLIYFRIPKFSCENRINVTLCQDYPSVLDDLTHVEECLIARCHPVGVILKLRPGGHTSPVNHHALKGHFIVIPQDPKPLLTILPSPDLHLHDIIKVFWLGERPPVKDDFKHALLVRKAKVLAALQFLVQHNPLYQDVAINHAMIDSWSDDFIPNDLQNNIIHLNEADHREREGYTVSLQSGNYENDLQAAQDISFDNGGDAPLMTGSVSTDIDGERQDPDLRMLDYLMGVVSDRESQSKNAPIAPDKENLPAVCYAARGKTTPVSHFTDPHYFPAAFPTLFPKGIGGHLDDRKIPVSIEAFAKWALTHHSRRYFTSQKFLGYFSLLTIAGLHVIKPSCISSTM